MEDRSLLRRNSHHKDYIDEHSGHTPSRRRCFVGLMVAVIVIGVAVGISMVIYFRLTAVEINLAKSLSVDNILEHLGELNGLANAVPSKSRSIVDAYNASAEYVAKTLTDSNYCEVQRQYFTVPVYNQTQIPTLTQVAPLIVPYVVGRDFSGTRYGGNGTYDFTASAKLASNLGCNLADFGDDIANNIAVVFDGNCTQYQKAMNAQQAQAKAILIVNGKGNALANWRVRSVSWTSTTATPLVQIPVLGITYSLGLVLQAATETVLHITTSTTVTMESTYNVLCLTKKGSEENIVVMGAHLDSVPEGPGINDNGSGSSTVLEVALEAARAGFHPVNKILFAWWGAEEIGLLGSRYFVSEVLRQSQLEAVPFNQSNYIPSLTTNNTLINLNFDMLGSPNYVNYIYNNTQFTRIVNDASFKVEQIFEEYFNDNDIPFELAPMTGGSDYYSFVESGIPAGALATGAGALKTEAERETYGGLANAAYDPCYHLSCDTTWNIDSDVLQDMSKAAAYVVQKLGEESELRKFLYE